MTWTSEPEQILNSKSSAEMNREVMRKFGGPERVRTVDLFHAMVSKSITYRPRREKQKTSTQAIWTSFGPHALFHVGLDLVRSSFPGSW